MPRRYRIRLGDGTVLMVDQQGLTTWKTDAKAMVQAAGGRWRPLKDLLAMQAAAAKHAEQDAAPAPTKALPLVPPPPRSERLRPPTARPVPVPAPEPIPPPVLEEPPPFPVLAEPASVNLEVIASAAISEPASEPATDEGPPILPSDFRSEEELAPLPDALKADEPPAFTTPEPPAPQAWADDSPAIFTDSSEPPSPAAADDVVAAEPEVMSFPPEPAVKEKEWDPEPSQWPDAVEAPATSARGPVQSLADDPAPRYEYASEAPTQSARSTAYSRAPSEERPVYSSSAPGFEEDENDDFLKPRPIVLNERFVWVANAFGRVLSRSLELGVRVSEDVRQAVRGKWEARAARRAAAKAAAAAAAAAAPIVAQSPDPGDAWPAIIDSPSDLRPAAPPPQPMSAVSPEPDDAWPAIVESPSVRTTAPQAPTEEPWWSRQDDAPRKPAVTEDVPIIPLKPRGGEALPSLDVGKYVQRLGRAVSGGAASLSAWTLTLRRRIENLRRSRPTPSAESPPWSEPDRPVAYEAPRKPIPAPPRTSEIPVLRLQKIEEVEEPQDMYEGPTESPFPTIWLWTKRIVWTAILGFGGLTAYESWESWYPKATLLSSSAYDEIARFVAAREQKERERRLLEESTAQLPHLAPDTIRLVLASSPNSVPDPPEVFYVASNAADRGISALTPAERQELKALRQELLKDLTPAERARIREYDDVRRRRMPFAFEDKSALDLYARGARALPEEGRERLQALMGKAVASGLASPIASPAPTPRKKATR